MDDINNLINNEEVIDSKTQIRLIKIYKETGNLDVRNRLISSYYKMIRKIIRKYNSNIISIRNNSISSKRNLCTIS